MTHVSQDRIFLDETRTMFFFFNYAWAIIRSSSWSILVKILHYVVPENLVPIHKSGSGSMSSLILVH